MGTRPVEVETSPGQLFQGRELDRVGCGICISSDGFPLLDTYRQIDRDGETGKRHGHEAMFFTSSVLDIVFALFCFARIYLLQ